MSLKSLLTEIRACRECESHLPMGPRPILAATPSSKILIVGQAPGIRVHESGIAWNDPSGDRLRQWTGLNKKTFYDPKWVAIVPMGFCYPGTGPSGDLPPRPECAALWHQRLFAKLKKVELTLVIGSFAQAYCLGDLQKKTLTETVRSWKEFLPDRIPLPHPSPRNNRWLKKNPWFESDVIPHLQDRIATLCK